MARNSKKKRTKAARNAYTRAWWKKNSERMKAYSRAWYAANKDAIQARARKRYRENREASLVRSRAAYARAAALGKRYRKGIPSPTRKPPKKCELCAQKQRRNLSLDHCHYTGKFRGWLCTQCNIGLGMFRNASALLVKAASYLRNAGPA